MLVKQHLCTALELLPFNFTYFISSTLRNQGPEGLVILLKDLKIWALQILAGSKDFKLPWYRTIRYRGILIPRRAQKLFKPFIRAILRSDLVAIRFYLSILNLHHTINGPSRSGIDKGIKAAFQPCKTIPDNTNGFVKGLLSLAIQTLDKPKHYGLRKNIGYSSNKSLALAPGVNGNYADHCIVLGDTIVPNLMGNLAFLGESGGKTRTILVSTYNRQKVLEPLKRCLLASLRSLPTDCTFDQTKGVTFVKENTTKGKTLWSYDLSDATWNFPLEWQKFVLHRIFGKEFDEGLELSMFQGPCWYKDPFTKKVEGPCFVQQGQAMGLGPSFPLFALTHNLLLQGLALYYGVPADQTFRVLGDDVVIANKEVAIAYHHLLTSSGVPISETKTIESSQLGEFAGKVIWKGSDVTPIKWRKISRDSFNLYREYRKILGPIVIGLINKADKDLLRAMGYIPVGLGGIGLRPYIGILEEKKHIQRLWMGFLELVISRSNRTAFGSLHIDPRLSEQQHLDIVASNSASLGSSVNLFGFNSVFPLYDLSRSKRHLKPGTSFEESIAALVPSTYSETLSRFGKEWLGLPTDTLIELKKVNKSRKPIDLRMVGEAYESIYKLQKILEKVEETGEANLWKNSLSPIFEFWQESQESG